ncbi:MAG: DUF255 domain-containing protein [Candidatus Methylomirabilis oxygeniifera]|nr:MAG: DUF255 domain-containing protein [Candidatus Methylomirabilis oxyfera]
MDQEALPRHTNRLIHETSPYLLQHAHNPVDWYPWGEEALRRAREENRPILLSIGYSACHWCHVMAHESFESEQIAELMNRYFVCIKVDREERPDLDAIYMAATLALNHGQGGWPMTVFLTPDLQPFFAGTYFPPRDGLGRPGFPTILNRVAQVWREQPDALRTQSDKITEGLRESSRPSLPMPVGRAEIAAAVAHFAATFDPTFGGFGAAPKFPAATALSLLLRHHQHTGDAHALQMVRTTLDAMARGGIYDQIGGGFARYSTDERWLIPHFEKMLYDNALLARTYLEAFQVAGDPSYRQIATELLDYILREMTALEGGFYSATDADSEGVEGKFYVWTPAEIEAILGQEEARRFCAYYDITPTGNWEGRSIPNIRRTAAQVAAKLGVSVEELAASIDRTQPKVYEARRKRVPPGLDDKILTAWNGLMVSAMAEGYRVLGERRHLDAAVRAADFLLSTLLRPDGRLLRTYRSGVAHLNAYLEDYACLCEGLIDLYEAGGETRYLREAVRLAERMPGDFADEESGAFHTTSRDHETLILRYREGTDGATPSGNAVAASALTRLSFHLNREEWRRAAEQAISAYGQQIARYPHAFAKSLAVVDLLLEGPVELCLIGNPAEAGCEALRREVGRHFIPNRIIAHHDPTKGNPPELPLLRGKGLVDGRAALYLCRNFTCQAPITDPAQVAELLGAAARRGAGGRRSAVGSFLQGSATEAGTAAYAQRFTPSGYGPLGATGLSASKLGFGGYRIDDETPEHTEALEQALRHGCNLIDTSTNYTDGGSERCVGAVLGKLARTGTLRREEVIVVSKIGYVQGQNLELAQKREAEDRPFPEMVKYMEGCWHCIHPEFLRDQLERSLTRLQIETLDVCLLHNPEYFLSDARARRRGDLESARNEFYRRLQEAFRFFESQVAAGTIRWYGVSSNTVVAPAADPEATSLTRMLAAAREAGGPAHHFRILQLPMNLFEAGALLTQNTGPDNRQTALEAASGAAIGALVNRPLNAIVGDRMVRLAASSSRRVHDAISAAIDPLLSEARRGESLSRKALWALASTPGVSCVLNGMRTRDYVHDSLGILPWPPLADVIPIYQAAQDLTLHEV